MAETTIYNIDSTDGTETFAIQPRVFDGVGGVQRNTDLTLYGNAAPNWGERFNENFYKLLENFAVDEKDTIPGVPKDESDLGGAGLGINRPVQGQMWFNKTDQQMYFYNGSAWVVASGSAGKVDKAGDTMSGILDLGGNKIINLADPTNDQDAATKKYVDNVADNFVELAGDTMTGVLILSESPGPSAPDLQAATKKYVDDQVLAATGASLTPLEGLTFVPVLQENILSFPHTSWSTVSNTYSSGVDITNSGSVTVPSNATHILIRVLVDYDTTADSRFLLKTRANSSASEITIMNTDPIIGISLTSYEYTSTVTAIIPFDTTTNTFEFTFEHGPGTNFSDVTGGNLDVWVEGFYVEDTGVVTPPRLTSAFYKASANSRSVSQNSNTTSDGPIEFSSNSNDYDIGGHFNTSTNKFVAPTTGFYNFFSTVTVQNVDVFPGGYAQLSLIVNDTIVHVLDRSWDELSENTNTVVVSGSKDLQLNAGDTVHINVSNPSGAGNILGGANNQSTFGGHIISLQQTESPGGFKNQLYNGTMRFWQRGTSFPTASGGYTADRWFRSGNIQVDRSTDVPSGTPFEYSALATVSGTPFTLRQPIENYRLFQEGTQWTASFWVKGTVASSDGVFFWSFSDDISTGNSLMASVQFPFNITTDWTRVTIPFKIDTAIPSGTTHLIAGFGHSTNYTGGFNITGVQIEQSPAATNFDFRPEGIELALCQRYFEKSYQLTDSPGTVTDVGSVHQMDPDVPFIHSNIRFATNKRAAPTVTLYNPVNGASNQIRKIHGISSPTSVTVTGVTAGQSGISLINLASSFTDANNLFAFHFTADAEF